MAALEHKNLVRIHHFGRMEGGVPYFTMERLRGKTLAAAIRELGVLPCRAAYEITYQLCEGLFHAHSGEPPLVHRDLKPSNVFLAVPAGGHPIVKILDFGLGIAADGNAPRRRARCPRLRGGASYPGHWKLGRVKVGVTVAPTAHRGAISRGHPRTKPA